MKLDKFSSLNLDSVPTLEIAIINHVKLACSVPFCALILNPLSACVLCSLGIGARDLIDYESSYLR